MDQRFFDLVVEAHKAGKALAIHAVKQCVELRCFRVDDVDRCDLQMLISQGSPLRFLRDK